MNRLSYSTLSGQDISAPLLIDTYTADADREILIQIYLSSLAGNGSYNICATKQLLGTGTAYQSPTSIIVLASTVTTAFLPSIVIPVKDTDVIKTYIEGLAGDTSVSIEIEVWDVTASEPSDVLAIKTKTDQLTFSGTNAVNANITHVIGDAVQENGANDTKWGGTP